ncbi:MULTISPECIES: ABC transporter ATP-binding protein [unclassified Candidatus Paralachnospira]|uniref:ABC transporter ATP-binding protein n=1 Tax=unclassified Candidatus Paralachnospira TaxID=3099471 RepID=UPI003F91B885
MAFLEVNNVSKQFGGLSAVSNVNFHVEKGEIVSIIGPNGAGKTTIFNLLTGVYDVTEGTIVFDGEEIQNQKVQRIVNAGIARTFQNIRLFKNMRTIENVMIGYHQNTKYNTFDLIFRTPRFRKYEKEAYLKALEVLESLGFGKYIHTYAGNLPYGEQRKLEIARAIATGAKLLLLDEPAAGMNPQESEELLNFIKGLQAQGFTIILIEHDMSVVMNISDRIYVLDHGKMIADGLPEEIANNQTVVEAYLGKSEDDADD